VRTNQPDSLFEWMSENFGNEVFEPGLERLKRAYAELGLSFQQQKMITIAGTNGKGETIRSLAWCLDQHKKSYALWTSPHLISITERFVLNGTFANEQELIQFALMLKTKLVEHELSYYEFLFLLFLSWVDKQDTVEYLLLEVGLGGRLDAVNILDADIVGLTSISRDHQEFLGNRYEMILKEKMGVVRPSSICFSALTLNYLHQRARKYCTEYRSIDTAGLSFSELNKSLAVKIFDELTGINVKPQQIPDMANQVRRLQINCEWSCYPSHNPDGIRKLFQFLSSGIYNKYKCLYLSFSKRKMADIMAMLKIVKTYGHMYQAVKLVPMDFGHKALSESEWDQIKESGVDFVKDDEEIFKHEANENILFTGSNYFIGHVLHYAQHSFSQV
jgi:dihydrofolate synthase/folylpolyglutamate synthase